MESVLTGFRVKSVAFPNIVRQLMSWFAVIVDIVSKGLRVVLRV